MPRISIGASTCMMLTLVFGSIAIADDRFSTFDTQLVPLLRTYCYDCHGNDQAEGEINLETFRDPDSVSKNRQLWQRVHNQIRLGSMPPADGPELDASIRKNLSSLVDRFVNAVDCVRSSNPGKVVLRRLTRYEYRNTINDLLGVDYPQSDGFPGDDLGYGFDNVGDVLSLPPLLMEKYLNAADEIVQKAIVTPPAADIYEIAKVGGQLAPSGGAKADNNDATLFSNGKVTLELNFPFSAEYVLTINARGDQAGNEPPRMVVSLGGKQQATINVSATEFTDYVVTFKTGVGKRLLDIAFTNDFYKEDPREDRNLYISYVEVRGESRRRAYLTDEEITEQHRKLIFVEPSESRSAEQASRAVLQRLASRAFRRPASETEVSRLCELAKSVRDDGGTFEEGIQVALQAILVSPHFLYKVERSQARSSNEAAKPLSDFELATRLSYLMWSSMPDDALLKSALEGKLREPSILRGHLARMIKDRRSNAFVENFAGQWLQLRNIDKVQPDTVHFPDADASLRELMKRETLTFFAGIMRENRPVTELIDAEYTYLNERLASFYGIKNVAGEQFRRVSLADSPRGGLLTQASILTVTSNPNRTSPVKRGKWILENLLNTPPPPPPPNVPELEKGELLGTLRQRMEQHRANPACAACHNVMDPLGFALENFDAVGKWRTNDGGDRIDASGQLPDGTSFAGVDDLRRMITESKRDQYLRCLTEKLMIYALGRGLEYYDKCAIDEIVAEAEKREYKFAYLLSAIIESKPFQSQGAR